VHKQSYDFPLHDIPVMWKLRKQQVIDTWYFNELGVEMMSMAQGYTLFKYIGRDQVNNEYLFLHEETTDQ